MKKIITSIVVILVLLTISACNGSSESNGTPYTTYREAIAANDFEAAHKIIAQAEADKERCHNKYERESFESKYGVDFYDGLKEAKTEIFDKEIKFLAADGSAEACARLVFLFTDYEIKGRRLSEGLNDYYSGYGNAYATSVDGFNSRLSMVLDLAISQDNKGLAQKIIKLYKENMDILMGTNKAPDGTEVDGNHCYVTYNWKDKEAAIKKYEDNFGSLKEVVE